MIFCGKNYLRDFTRFVAELGGLFDAEGKEV